VSLARDALLHAGLLTGTAATGAAAAAALAHGVLGLVEEGRHVCCFDCLVVVVCGGSCWSWKMCERGCQIGKWGEGGMRARRLIYAFQTCLGPSSFV
jgi:hypothetical protein